MTLEPSPKLFICITCDSGPWSRDAKGSDGNSIVRLHESLNHDVVEFEANTNESLKDGVRVDVDKPISINTPIDMELESITDDGLYTEVNRQDPTISAIKIIEYSIFERKIIDKSEIFKIINSWQKRFVLNWNSKQIGDLINNVWCDKETFRKIKLIAFQLGAGKKTIKLDRGQIHEVAEWLKGRYHIKRIDIDGKLLFYNDRYYEKKANELIRR
mgnify:CR=1 FL=1